jgi:flagellar protein FliO/FliZ
VPAAPFSVASVAHLSLSLLAIVALIVALSFAMKRLKMAGPRGRGGLAVIDELALGPRDRIVLVRVGESQVLVGIGASGMVGLTPLETPIAVGPASGAAPFALRLREWMKPRVASK